MGAIRSTGWGAALAFAAALGATPAARAQTVYIDDRLTAAPTGGAAAGVTAGARGGRFDAEGWTTTGPTDTVWWVIPAAIPRGRFEVTATGLSVATSLTGQEHDLLAIYGGTDRAEPVPYNPWYRNNEFKAFVRVFGAMNTCSGCQAVGASKLELALCPALAPSGYVESMCPAACVSAGYDFWQAYLGPRGRGENLPWDAATAYRFVITWEPGRITYSRGGAERAESITFPGTYAPRELRVRLGPPSSERGPDTAMPRGVTFRDVRLQGEPGAATPSCAAAPTPVDSGTPVDTGAPVDTGTPRDVAVPTTTLEFPAVEDVTVNMTQPTTVYADVRDLAVEREAEAYVKFRVGALPGAVVRAELVLQTATSPSAAGSGASVYRARNADWSEATLTYAARPGPNGGRLDRVPRTRPDATYTVDVTPAITGAGTYAFALVPEPDDNDGVHFDSKEVSAARGPRLRLTVDTSTPPPDAGPTPSDAGPAPADATLATDTGAPPRDGGTPPDAALDARADDAGTPPPDEPPPGCACRATLPAAGSRAGAALALAALAVAVRRRRGATGRAAAGA